MWRKKFDHYYFSISKSILSEANICYFSHEKLDQLFYLKSGYKGREYIFRDFKFQMWIFFTNFQRLQYKRFNISNNFYTKLKQNVLFYALNCKIYAKIIEKVKNNTLLEISRLYFKVPSNYSFNFLKTNQKS